MNGDPTLTEISPGLYQIGTPPFTPPLPTPNVIYAYLLTITGSPSPTTLGATWMGAQWNGWYLFLTEEITTPRTFVTAARQQLPVPSGPPPDWRGLVWLASADPSSLQYSLALQQSGADSRTLVGGTSVTFEWGPFGLQFSGAPTITYDAQDAAFFMTGFNTFFIQLFYGGVPQQGGYLPYGGSPGMWQVTLPAAGSGAGGFQIPIAIDPGNLTANLSLAPRYFYPSGGTIADLYYTFSPPVPMTTVEGNYLGFNAVLHPLLTTDPAWSMLVLDTSGTNQFQLNSASQIYPYFSTTNGEAIVLDPNAPPSPFSAGYAFCVAPAAGSPDSTTLYLAPAGTFRVGSVAGHGPGSPGMAAWMCGLSAQESLDVQAGDLVGLVPGMPGYSAQFSPTGSPAGSPPASPPGSPSGSPGSLTALSGRYTTSWLQFPLATGSQTVERNYFGQPSKSVFFAATDPSFSTPVSSLLAELTSAIFPLVPYSGTYDSQLGTPNVPPFNVGVPPATFAAFESTAISTDRHAAATAGTDGPRFFAGAGQPPPMRLLGSGATGWTSLTPQGFVVQLGSDGSWQALLLARDPTPGTPPRYLSFDAGTAPTVSRDVANAVLQDQLFLVISDAANLGAFQDKLSLQGFNFTLDVGTGDVETVLILKFNTSLSLAELAQTPNLWAATDTFITDLATTQQRILDALAVAGVLSPAAVTPSSTDPFAYFRQIAADPSWTGILALNCQIDGNGMPPDLQMILGGINGQLRAHHLGIEQNRVTSADGVSMLEDSSLFGVILYPLPGTVPSPPPVPAPALDYNVETLQVVFANSAITQFNVEVGLTINNIFGRDTLLAGAHSPFPPGENVILIPGQYQQQGSGTTAVGVVLFNVLPTTFTFPVPEGATRVLEELSITSGSLAPVSFTLISPAGTSIVARFNMGGALRFRQNPFPNASGLDIFSFDALPFTNLSITLDFDLDATGALQPGSKVLTFSPSLLKPTSEGAVLRPNSLLGSIPLQISGFLTATPTQPLSTSSLGAQIVHSLQLEGQASSSSPASPSGVLQEAAPPTDYPYVTSTPAFALQFNMPLGSLGALSDVVSLTANLLLGWGPSSLIPGADAAAVFVQLPSLSAGYGSFNLQGILQTTFGDANLLRVELQQMDVYAVLFNNIKLSVLGFSFPPGVVIDFLLFAGQPDVQSGGSTNSSNIAWYLSAQQQQQQQQQG